MKRVAALGLAVSVVLIGSCRTDVFSASAGGFIRQYGNESFKPQAELRLIFRL